MGLLRHLKKMCENQASIGILVEMVFILSPTLSISIRKSKREKLETVPRTEGVVIQSRKN